MRGVVEKSVTGGRQRSLIVRAVRRSPLQRLTVRRLTAGRRQWPDFVIIGAQRAGTTSLTQWLYAHPQVKAARARELHYFDLNYGLGPNWYRSNFPVRSEGQISGESTPYLLFHPLAPERVARDLPETTRFIVLLREPVERAISQYWLNRRCGHEPLPFRDAVDRERERLAGQEEIIRRGQLSDSHQRFSYVARGRYAEQLQRWFRHVHQERILVVQSEELFESTVVADGVQRWLGLEASGQPFPRGNDAVRHEEIDSAVIDRLRTHFAPLNQDLEDLLGRPFWRP